MMLRLIRFLILPILIASLAPSSFAQRNVRVKIERADFLRHDDKIGKNTQSLNGRVILSHHNTFLHCDSAYMYNDSNVVIAYGNIHVIQNDSIHLYGDRMTYLGDQNLVKIRDNVRANKGQTWLYTEFLDYDRLLDKAYFFNGGRVVNNANTLTSGRGVYYPMTNNVFFKDSVVGRSPKYTLYSDTSCFNTRTEIVSILSPTQIFTSDSNVINSEDGWYDTHADVAKLLKNNKVESKGYTLVGDTILYQRRQGLGTVWGNMVLVDSTDNVTLCGDYGFYNENTQAALATKHALAYQVYASDTIFAHADTFRIVPLADTSRIVKAYHHVKFFRQDVQGRCDSLIFDFRDSVATMFDGPVLWSQGNQMTANVIKLRTRNQALYQTDLLGAAFVISIEPDSVGFNQVKGKTMIGHVRANELYRIDVDGNGQTIYYPKDGPNLIGINRAESSNMTIWLKDRRVKNITMRVSPSGNMNPPLLLGEKDCKLAGFRWLEDFRPKSKDDVFLVLDIPEDLEAQEEVYEGYTFDELGE